MSEPLPVAATAIDWKLIGSAVGVFIATIVTTVWGWMQGRKKADKASSHEQPFQIAGAVLQDNTSLRDNTLATRELRDQILLLVHILERHVRVQDDLHDDLEQLIKRLDRGS